MPNDALTLTHIRTGLSVTVTRERSWFKTAARAKRILAARVHAHDKGVKILDAFKDFEEFIFTDNEAQVIIGPDTFIVSLVHQHNTP